MKQYITHKEYETAYNLLKLRKKPIRIILIHPNRSFKSYHEYRKAHNLRLTNPYRAGQQLPTFDYFIYKYCLSNQVLSSKLNKLK